ncbi:hypothetical protein SAMN05877753_10213 [Bacillus oleivorans]|uniref:Uncharacterized protein n=1 Tax=Bacillus oleivorans TaxID=1448271 RepID=A0A285CJW4_9BACI|nr:hypothetical protein [Bacillus oleivorans]SNX67809.1 hypothetical protein SAMN05877753_10213 [Bacillus oleivorans]
MGRSTVQQLITRAQNMNSYNNSGVESNIQWVDFFNEALVQMVDDLNLEEVYEIPYTLDQREYTLPDDFYGLLLVNDLSKKTRLAARRNYDQVYPYGYWIMDKGSHFALDVVHSNPTTLQILYKRYPKQLNIGEIATQKPEVPTVGETALCFKAINRALLNNNQVEQANYFDELYNREKGVIRTAGTRAKG